MQLRDCLGAKKRMAVRAAIFDLARRKQRGFARHRAVVGNMLQARAFERMNVLPVAVFARAMRRFGRVLRAGGIVVRDVLAEDMFERRAGVGHRIRRAAASAFARLRAVDEALLAARVVRIIRNVMAERRAFRSDRVGRVAAAARSRLRAVGKAGRVIVVNILAEFVTQSVAGGFDVLMAAIDAGAGRAASQDDCVVTVFP